MKKAREYQPDWVWIMDDDTVPTETCLEELLNASEQIKGKYKLKKMGVILKAFFAFVFGTYDRKAFRDRESL